MTTDQWPCPTCSKVFARKGDLTRHANLHIGYKPYECSDCGKSFSQFSGLKTHRNVHTKVKPFLCGMDGCKAAFGDPSSRARHCKETHRTLGAYRCPVARCKSSIKRRSAFAQHLLRKHNIDPETIDIDALAPPLLPRHVFSQRRSVAQHLAQQPSQQGIEPVVTTSSDVYFDEDMSHARYIPEATGSLYFYTPQLPDEQMTSHSWFSTQPIEMPSLLVAGLYTIDSLSSPPDFSHSVSSSPAPSRADLLRTPDDSRGPSPYASSSPSTPIPSPLSQTPLLFFAEPTYAAHGHQKSTQEWDFEASIFGTTPGQFQGIDV